MTNKVLQEIPITHRGHSSEPSIIFTRLPTQKYPSQFNYIEFDRTFHTKKTDLTLETIANRPRIAYGVAVGERFLNWGNRRARSPKCFQNMFNVILTHLMLTPESGLRERTPDRLQNAREFQ